MTTAQNLSRYLGVRPKTLPLLLLSLLLATADFLPAQDRMGDFGFSGMEVFRLGAAGGPWHAADLDADGDLEATAKDFLKGSKAWTKWVPADVAKKVKASL